MNNPTPRASGVRAVGFPDQATNPRSRRVRFEEVTPAHEYAAFLTVSIAPLVAHLRLPIFDGYDDLDDLQLAFLTLPSGETVTLGEYAGAPGTSIYVEATMQNIPQIVFDSCQQLRVSRQEVEWFHPDWQAEIDRLYAEHGGIEEIERNSILAALSQNNESEPIDCFYHALEIYTREKLPEYWAMLQHNLGLAYFDRIKGERWKNLQKSIECFYKSLEVFTQDKFPQKWQINQEDLSQSKEVWQVEKPNLVKDILDCPLMSRDLFCTDLSITDLSGAELIDANLIGANLSGTSLNSANLSGASLNNANLSGASLNNANLSSAKLLGAKLLGANLSFANLIGTNLNLANLSGVLVYEAKFRDNEGISESMRRDLIARGAIFEDDPGDRSESRTLVPR
jgi:Pentapeptide repeats (8 copies)